MFYPKIHEQTILEISQGDSINATANSFLTDRQARELSKYTLKFYREFLRTFLEYCNADSVTFIQEITPGILRRYFLAFGEKHNPGGAHGADRTLRAFFQWALPEKVETGVTPFQWTHDGLGFVGYERDGLRTGWVKDNR